MELIEPHIPDSCFRERILESTGGGEEGETGGAKNALGGAADKAVPGKGGKEVDAN